MMKIVFSLWFVLCVTLAGFAQQSFKITGRLGGTLGGDLVLAASGPGGLVKLDEAVMVDGEFEFSGSVEGVIPAYILAGEQQQPVATIMLENLEYVLVAGNDGIEVQGGGEAQEIWSRFDAVNKRVLREKMKIEQEARDAYARQDQMKLQALQQQFGKVAAEAEARQQELFRTYKDSFVAAYAIASGMGQMDYTSLKALYDALGEPAKNSPYGQMIDRQLAVFKQVEPGSVAPDFSGTTAEGTAVSLHGIKAKVKLVDFWASWCGPCRQEMPNVCKIYKKYHAAGLEILGVSLDTKPQDWVKAMQEEKMTWLNIVDQSKEISARYLVRGIPHTILLDENNRIIAKNLRGKALEKKIAELLGK
ncbi:TlpA disulfide reductase family protein [Butyricimonas synergistica]|uniref:TlpA disulfide reductase family protein n=1 Tax=Butyricimonas synergistica TaxID=544644 RepID=UPI00035F9E25|nr:TlpA disulfide reductase family protein [Butyricimonas synergistica]